MTIAVPQVAVPEVTIAVPTIRRPDRLAECLRAALGVAAADEIAVELVIVLDGADLDVCDFVVGNVDGATVVSWPERRGVAAGLNAACRVARAPCVVVLQDDARPRPGWLTSLTATAARYPRAGVIGSLLLCADGSVQTAGAIILGDGLTHPPWLERPPGRDVFRDVRSVDYVASASMLVRRDAWRDVGGFDETMYPAIYVDADFCTAAWDAGWQVLLDPGSVVEHDRHGSMASRFRDFVFLRNRARFLERWAAFIAGRPVVPVAAIDIDAEVARAAAWLDLPPESVAHRRPASLVEDDPEVYIRREREVTTAFVAELEARFSALEDVYGHWLAVEAHARALEARIAEYESRLT